MADLSSIWSKLLQSDKAQLDLGYRATVERMQSDSTMTEITGLSTYQAAKVQMTGLGVWQANSQEAMIKDELLIAAYRATYPKRRLTLEMTKKGSQRLILYKAV